MAHVVQIPFELLTCAFVPPALEGAKDGTITVPT